MEHCDFPKCKNSVDLIYVGHPICGGHWQQLCDADSKTEKKLLKQIDLVRNTEGCVVVLCSKTKKKKKQTTQ